ncbi:MAG: transposase [gamma proteobacterium symbiont of Bathyaustriella thionipta]|nr:transposase [gamma proteobacterium symbiont of Bathyaustriella thionipta]MCU7948455.1 transposase [gamma proteobacterium symbiont of Bathyaustriella thionipta]MCU7952451.1 transposase [gamma proteobacterium symbiont of Bathyaustriella thionipta]MCU7955377.1 transposase [gamma proteobacterium symbiont of Bathyaustriella thionipta]MCU7968323.1 transposase [gamma proteobacterium symbiont of Bathyaustriella thionipta]
MARLPRLNLPGIPQHVIQRGNNHQACFFSEQDYTVYLDKLNEYSKKYKVQIHSYILMTNHVHLLLTPEDSEGVSRLLQSLGRYYVRYINQTYQRSGTLWEGRFKSTLVDSENYLLTVSRYIELNPVRAQMVSHPADYPWSSFKKNALGKNVNLITPHACYQSLGNTDKERQTAYLTLFAQELNDKTLEEIRTTTNKAWVLGEKNFKKQVEKQTGRRASPSLRGGDRKSAQYKLRKENHC